MLDAVTPRAVPLPPDERRAAILRAARPLLHQHGASLTTRQIADAAQVAEGTLFRVFDGKDAIIDALIDQAMDPTPTCEALAAIDASLPLEQRIRLVVIELQERIQEISGMFATLMSRERPRQRPSRPSPEVERARADQLRDAIVAVIGADADELWLSPEQVASHIRSIAFATSHPFFADRSLTHTDEIVRVILHGVLKESSC